VINIVGSFTFSASEESFNFFQIFGPNETTTPAPFYSYFSFHLSILQNRQKSNGHGDDYAISSRPAGFTNKRTR